MLHAAWEAVRAVAWGLTWAVYAVYVAAALAMALALLAVAVTSLLALIPDREPPAAKAEPDTGPIITRPRRGRATPYSGRVRRRVIP